MWMDPAWDGSQGPRPHTASVHVRELSWQGLHNPCPQSRSLGSHGDSCREQLLEHLSPARLRVLAQVDNLQLVRVLEMCVDTRESSLGNFGVHLPNLDQLKLNGSRLSSLRDLGTSLSHLQVLWLARCGLTDLDGIGSFPVLKELYVSYNDISDLSPLCLLEQLEVLDLEGNSVEDLGQVCSLRLCPQLTTLTLEGNPVCLQPAPGHSNKVPQDYNYRVEVRKLIPQLQVLDEVSTRHTELPAPRELSQDWLIVKEAIKEGRVLDTFLPPQDVSHGAIIRRLDPAFSLPETQPWALSLLVPGGVLPERLLPKDMAPEDHTSNLTHGAGQVLCGNPTKGLWERRRQNQDWAPWEQLPPYKSSLATSPSTPGPGPADTCDLLTMAGLQAWRELGLCPQPHRQMESQQEGAAAPQDPWRAPEEQEDQIGPKTVPSPMSLASEHSRTVGFHLIPSAPKCPMPPDSGSSSPRGSAVLSFRGRRLRALDSLCGSPGGNLRPQCLSPGVPRPKANRRPCSQTSRPLLPAPPEPYHPHPLPPLV
ncbi:leucine-rich repeat-containing protein 56 isoform X2 [Marmota monax]|uniref:leucine-rich repeat-containing protein 56 isoform X2 n=1 Tax=Marmota monax TaxID=9995 RepID=UPI0026E9BE72|nr:leucine-rich repeat-containing protein 56 isoform X2 [Marmota monax]